MAVRNIKFDEKERVETGPVKFGDDWPGIFIRGDNALGYSLELRIIQDLVRKGNIDALDMLDSLIELFYSCRQVPNNVTYEKGNFWWEQNTK